MKFPIAYDILFISITQYNLFLSGDNSQDDMVVHMKRWGKAVILVVMGLCLCLVTGNSVEAEETGNRLKVLIPLMNDSGFVTCKDGVFSGYYIDYLTEIAKYTGWNYEYTPIETEEELELACEQGDFDLLAGMIYSEKYDVSYFDYPEYTVGAKKYVLAVPGDSGLIPDKEYSYLKGIRIGIAESDDSLELEKRFRNFCFMYGISCRSDQAGKYPNGVNFIHIDSSSWRDKLRSGEIDGILSSDAFCLSQEMYAIATFGLDQIYFAVPNGSMKIIKQLNDALEKIGTFDPEYSERLYDNYFKENRKYKAYFNEEEKDFIEQGHVWRVCMPKGCAPYSYINDEEKPAGLIIEVLNKIEDETGGKIQFEYSFYDSMQEAANAVKGGEGDINGLSMYSLLTKRDVNECRSMSFYEDSFMYYKNNGIANEKGKLTAAVPELPVALMEKINIESGSTAGAAADLCLEQVEKGKSSYTVMLSHMGDYYKSYYGYNRLSAYAVPNGDVMFCFSYSAEMEQMAVTVINKCLAGVDGESLDNYVTEVSLFEHKQETMKDYIKEHLAFFAMLLVGILFVICALLFIIILSVTHNSGEVYKLLYMDDITGGISFKKFMKEAEKPGKMNENSLVLYINISGFKYINDMYGYGRGNEVLCEVKNFLDTCLPGCIFARVYADRFVALVPYTSLDEVNNIIQERLDEFEQICRLKFPSFNIWIKAGAYVLQEKDNLQKAVNLANYAVDEIQKTSKNEFVFYDDVMYNRVLIQKEIEKDMRGAMENGEFETFYQPKYNIETRQLIGAEALVRWRHPQKGLLSPDTFIPVFEQNSYIIQLDYYIFECVCRFIRGRMEDGKMLFPISSNFSRLHLNESHFTEHLTRIANRYEVPHEYLELEITETVATEDFERFIAVVKQLKTNGFHVSIDDFGSGHSAIQLLYKLPIDVLKFDKTFVDNEDVNALEAELVDSIISVSLKNGIQIICEGVETPEQEEFVRKHNCIFVQGFLYSRPVTENEFRKLLAEEEK